MQDEVNEKTMALCIKGGKISAQLLKAALTKLLSEIEKKKQQSKKMGGQNRCKRGKQSIKSLQQSGAQLTNIVVTDNNIQDITFAIAEAKAEDDGKSFTVKQMEKTKKTLQAKLQKLNDQSRKDDVVTFEQLGVDRLFVDESHFYKNMFLYTKMRNIAGIAQTDAQKSSDMFAKCQYLDEITGGKGCDLCNRYACIEQHGRAVYHYALLAV